MNRHTEVFANEDIRHPDTLLGHEAWPPVAGVELY